MKRILHNKHRRCSMHDTSMREAARSHRIYILCERNPVNTDCNQDNARTLSRRIWDTQSHAHCLTGPRPKPFPDSLARFCTEPFSRADADDIWEKTGHLPHPHIARRRGLVLRVEMTRSDGRSNDRATRTIHSSPSISLSG